MKKKPINLSSFRHLYPFQSHFMDMNGFRYHYVDQGSGPPVIMVHGNPTWSFYYRNLIQALSPDFRAIAVDHIGCGLSDKPGVTQYGYTLDCRVKDLERFIRRLELKEKITFVLHDWGGMIGIAYALNHLERMDKIILLNTTAFFPPPGTFPALQTAIDSTGQPVCQGGGFRVQRFCAQCSVHGKRPGLVRRREVRVTGAVQLLAEPNCHPQVRGGHPAQTRRSQFWNGENGRGQFTPPGKAAHAYLLGHERFCFYRSISP